MGTRFVVSAALIIALGYALAAQTGGGAPRTGVFAGPVAGLRYQTPTGSGTTNAKGEFQYRAGEVVSFSIGGVVLGSARGADRVNIAQLVTRVDGNINKLVDPALTNLARFLQTLDQDGNIENGVTIAPEAHQVIGYRPINFAQHEEAFPHDREILRLLAELNTTPGVFTGRTPRLWRTPAEARNEVRRNIRGIIKTTDVRIPLRDGSFQYADVFRPAAEGKYPVVIVHSLYGKAFPHDCICSPEEALEREEMEERYFSGNPDGFLYENHEAVDSAVWVPRGYAVVRVDGRGTCNTPGTLDVLSLQESKDYYDAIEWAGVQPWSSGNVGMWGMSYTAMNQYNVAALHPPHLKAMIAIGTDTISFEDSLYNGGLMNEEFWTEWVDRQVKTAVCGKFVWKDFVAIAKANPFYDPAIYGPEGNIWITPDVENVTIPQWITMPTTHRSHIHQRASSEVYVRTRSKYKKLKIAENWFSDSYTSTSVADHVAFFDYWLKGVKNGIMDEPPVRVFIRTGNGAGYWQNENEWPIARTKYTKFYLDATPSTWAGDGRRRDFLRLSQSAPSAEKRSTYSAEVPAGMIYRPPLERLGTPPSGGGACWATGVSFVTDPMPDDLVVAGYMKLGVWVSSTSSDMDVYAAVRVIDDQNREVDFSGPPDPVNPTNVFPVGWGLLRVGHRKLDPKWSTDWRPIYTYTKADYKPLTKGEVVATEIEIWPNTAVVRKGHRIRLDVQPYDSCGSQRHSYDPSYHTGAANTIYAGPGHPSYLQVPVIPAAGAAAPTAVAR